MQKFLDQFKMTPGLAFHFDNCVYSKGVTMLGRRSGIWSDRDVGDGVFTLVLGKSDVEVGPDGLVRIINPLMGDHYLLTPDHAALGFSLMVVNWFWNINADKMNAETYTAFERVYFGLLDACRKSGSRELLRFID